MRVLRALRPCAPFALRSLVPMALWPVLLGAHAVSAAPCDPMASELAALDEADLPVRGREFASRRERLPAGANVLVLAGEQGVNVTLSVALEATRLGSADSPVERSGIQRLLFTAPRAGDYTITLQGKEDTEQVGTVRLRVVVLGARTPDGECLQVQRSLATAEAAYATGRLITEGTGATSGADAVRAYQSAAAEYSAVLAKLASAEPSLLRAQVQHALAFIYLDKVLDLTEAVRWGEQAARGYADAGDAYGDARAQQIQAAASIELAVSPPAQVSRAQRVRTGHLRGR